MAASSAHIDENGKRREARDTEGRRIVLVKQIFFHCKRRSCLDATICAVSQPSEVTFASVDIDADRFGPPGISGSGHSEQP